MPTIKVESPGLGPGAKVWLDGVLVPHLTNVRVEHPVDGVLRAEISVLGQDGLDLTAEDGKISVDIRAAPGWRIVATPQPDGRIVYRTEEDVKERQTAAKGQHDGSGAGDSSR